MGPTYHLTVDTVVVATDRPGCGLQSLAGHKQHYGSNHQPVWTKVTKVKKLEKNVQQRA